MIRSQAQKEEIIRLACKYDFATFVHYAWPHIDPAPLVWGWHMDAVCAHLQAIADKKIRKLIITIPPGHSKSLLVSVLWPAWMWANNPTWGLVGSSYNADLGVRDAVKARTLMRSEWYQSLFVRDEWDFAADQDNKTYYVNTLRGQRTTISTGNGTGRRGDCFIIDDPINAQDAYSKTERESAIEWFKTTAVTRFNDKATGTMVIIMQRLHEQDLAGWVLENDPEFVHLNLPTEFEPNNRCVTPIWQDPRTQEGELLFPEKFGPEVIADFKRVMGEATFAAQHQQRPVPASGGMLKRDWFTHQYHTVPTDGTWLIAADCAFKSSADNDRVAVGVWQSDGVQARLIDLAWGNMGFVDTVKAIADLKKKWPKVSAVIIEDKANGTAAIEVLKKQIPGVIPVSPDGGKESRIAAITAYFEAGNVLMPAHAPWLDAYVTECCSFPKGVHDDAIDMTAYALNRLLVENKLHKFAALAKW